MKINADNFGECIGKIAARGKISTSEALDLLNEVADRGEKMRRSGVADPFVSAAQDLAQKLKENAEADRIDALRNAAIRNSVMIEIEHAGGLKNAELTLRSIVHGTNEGGRDSVESMWKGNAAGWQAQLSWALRRDGLEKAALSGALDKDVSQELWAMNAGESKPASGNNPARKIAEAIQPLLDHARDRLNGAGARIEDAFDYVAHTLHDPAKLRRAAGPGATPDDAFAAWWKATEPLLAQKTFDGITPREGETPAMMRARFGRSVFDALVTGVHMTPDGAFGLKGLDDRAPAAFEGTSNLARRLSRPRVLLWKDGEAWHSYMAQFGAPRSLAEGVMATLDKSARQLALMEKLGTNPAGNFNLIVRRVMETYRDDLDGVLKFKGKVAGLDAVMAHLDGRANIPANEMAARIGASVRAYEGLSSLGSVGVAHFASIWPTVTSELAHHGEGRLATLGKLVGALARGRGSEERQEVLAQLGAYSHGLTREMWARWQPEDTVPGRISSLASTFMKYTGIHYIFDNTQAAVRETLANQLARNAGRTFDALDPHLAQMLGKYGIRSDEWNLLRAVPDLTTADGFSYMTPRDALRVDRAAVERYLRARETITDKSTPDETGAAVDHFAQSLSDKLYSYYGDAAAHAVVTPGVRERALVLGPERPGTFGGELRRFLVQFKMWPLAAMNQVIGREIYTSLSRSEAAWNLGILAALSMAGGYLRMVVSDASSGRPIRDPRDPAVMAEALAQGGGLGVLGDFLFGEASRFNGGLVGAAGGPAIGDADQLIKIFSEWKQGKAGWPELAHFGVRHVPFANLVYLKGALDYLLWYHLYEAASPGCWERTNRRMLREQGHAMSGYVPGEGVPSTPWGLGSQSDQEGGSHQSANLPAATQAPERPSRLAMTQPPEMAGPESNLGLSEGIKGRAAPVRMPQPG